MTRHNFNYSEETLQTRIIDGMKENQESSEKLAIMKKKMEYDMNEVCKNWLALNVKKLALTKSNVLKAKNWKKIDVKYRIGKERKNTGKTECESRKLHIYQRRKSLHFLRGCWTQREKKLNTIVIIWRFACWLPQQWSSFLSIFSMWRQLLFRKVWKKNTEKRS